MKIYTKRIALFFSLLILGISFQAFILECTDVLTLQMYMMCTPGLMVLMVAAVTKLPFKSFGWRLPLKWILLGWLIPILYSSIAYILCWTSGLADAHNPISIESIKSLQTNFSPQGHPIPVNISILDNTAIGFATLLFYCFGSELAWRGFLAPELTNWFSFPKAGLASGFVWLLWQLTPILAGYYEIDGIPIWYQVFCYSILVLSSGIILTYLRMKSKSIWPSVIYQFAHYSIIYNFYNKIIVYKGMTEVFLGEFGIALCLTTAVFAVFFYFSFRKIDRIKFEID